MIISYTEVEEVEVTNTIAETHAKLIKDYTKLSGQYVIYVQNDDDDHIHFKILKLDKEARK